MRWLVALGVAAAACGPRAADAPVATPREGVSLALHAHGGTTTGVVDDRRWIRIDGGTLVIDRIDAEAALSSLLIEPLDRAPLRLGTCVRERLTAAPEPTATPLSILSPIVRCRVEGTAGRRFVRIAYVTSRLTFATRHHVQVRGNRARIVSRFTIATPAWQRTGDIALIHGAPGGPREARVLARGAITLDGGIAVLVAPPREVAAAIRLVFDGGVREPGDDPRSDEWGQSSRTQVMAWLELAGELARAPATVEVLEGERVAREIAIPAESRDRVAGKLRLPLWIDEQLIGRRKRRTLFREVHDASDEVELALSNHGSVVREVWIEERLRPARDRVVRSPQRTTLPVLVGNVARSIVKVAPGSTELSHYIIDYRF